MSLSLAEKHVSVAEEYTLTEYNFLLILSAA
jgi:hypothetical protein